MVGWRRAFFTSTHKHDDHQTEKTNEDNSSPRFSAKLRLFTTSNLSTPRLQPTTKSSSPSLSKSNPASPRPHSPFAILKSTLGISKSRCGICLHNVKTSTGIPIFTADCSHSFHLPCVTMWICDRPQILCPVCGSKWIQSPIISNPSNVPTTPSRDGIKKKRKGDLKVYDDDQPLMSPASGSRFISIPESDETDESGEFQGFFVSASPPGFFPETSAKGIEFRLSPETALVSVSRSHETHAIVLKVKAQKTVDTRRAPIDLVMVLDVGGSMTDAKLQITKRTLRSLISSLCSSDRLSIVAYSATTKRLLPLVRMNASGQRCARRVVDSLVVCHGQSCAGDALKKAEKVFLDRRERNAVAKIIILSDGHDRSRSSPLVSSTRFGRMEIPVHAIGSGGSVEAALGKCISDLLSVVIQDVRVRIRIGSGSTPSNIPAVYSSFGRATVFEPDSVRVGELYSEEERDFLIELNVPTSEFGMRHHVLSVTCSYMVQGRVMKREQVLAVPQLCTVRVSSSNLGIERLRCVFVSTRAVAESRGLVEREEFKSAHRLLLSARALLQQSGSEFVTVMEAELADVNRVWQKAKERVGAEGKAEALTPTSAWKAAERLAKLAIMRKSLNRVSDLHGFENARF